MKRYDTVRIKSVCSFAQRDPWRVNRHLPQPGDIGTIVEVILSNQTEPLFIVESVDDKGETRWLAEFSSDDIESTVE